MKKKLTKNILITGMPGPGKSYLTKKYLTDFYSEVRDKKNKLNY